MLLKSYVLFVTIRSSDRGLDEPTNEKTLENDEAEPKSTFTEKDPSDEGSRLIARKPFLPNKCK